MFRRQPRYKGMLIFAVVILIYAACYAFAHFRHMPLKDSSSWIVATAVIAAVGALFKDTMSRWLWGPELEVYYEHKTPYVDDPPFLDSEGTYLGDSYFFRFRVRNAGSATAEKVHVLALNLWKGGAVKRRYTMTLNWSNAGARIVDISQGTERLCDIGFIVDPEKRKEMGYAYNLPTVGPDKTLLTLETEVKGTHRHHLLKPGVYQLFLVIGAANHDPIHVKVDIDVKGDWYNKSIKEMCEKGVVIGVTEIEPPIETDDG
jgi:hypothetical protein